MLYSPNRNYPLQQLDGSGASLLEYGGDMQDLATTMSETIARLQRVRSTEVISKATDKLKDDADTAVERLSPAEVRYRLSGEVIVEYAGVLQSTQNWISENADAVRNAETRYQDAIEAESTARTQLSDAQSGSSSGGNSDVSTEQSVLNDAETELREARTERNDLWEDFETRFSDWSDAYDDAVDGLDSAMTQAGNNDGWWDILDWVLLAIAVVLLVLTVIALIIGAPFFGLLGLAILALGVVAMVLTVIKYANDRAELWEVALSVVSLVPFGSFARYANVGPLVQRGQNALTGILRNQPLGPVFSSGNIFGRLGNALTGSPPISWIRSGAQWLRAPGQAANQLPNPGNVPVGLFQRLAHGSDAGAIQAFVQAMRNSPHAAGLSGVISAGEGMLNGGRGAVNVLLNLMSPGFAAGGVGSALP